jgi:acyl-CoA dehydrogenase
MAETMFADLAARVLADASPDPENGYDAPLWAELASTGLDRLLLPEALGGAGDAFEEAIAVMIAFGRAGAALPLADTLVANWCLARAGLDVAEGPKAFLAEPDVAREGAAWSGAGYWLPVVERAVLVSEIEGVVRVEAIGGDVAGDRGESVSGEPLTWIARDGAMSGDGPAVAEGLSPGQPLALAAALDAAAIVGALDRICALSIDYANTRRQFGRPIARFQAVQAMVARLACETAAARAAVEHAATMLGTQAAPFWAGVAKARASEAAGKAAACAHQIHGAIGFTREYELHRHTRRLWTWRERRGNERYWNERIGSAAARAGGEGLWPGIVDGLTL